MRRMKLSITGRSNQVLRHPIRSCYGMILQAGEGSKEKSNYNIELKNYTPMRKTPGIF